MAVNQDAGVTRQFCTWVNKRTLDDVRSDIRERAKCLILDGRACAVVAAIYHGRKRATDILLSMESVGNCPVWGYNKKVGPLPSTLLKTTQIQGFKYRLAFCSPAAFQHDRAPGIICRSSEGEGVGELHNWEIAISTSAGYKTDPLISLRLHGNHMLSWGWHLSVRLGLQTERIEDACGIGKRTAVPDLEQELVKGLGGTGTWRIDRIRVKPHAAMARWLGGSTAADGDGAADGLCVYVAAVQLVDGEVQPQQFHPDRVDRDEVWELAGKMECRQTTIQFHNGSVATKQLDVSKEVDSPWSNEEIVDNFPKQLQDVSRLEELLAWQSQSPLEQSRSM
ncbi:hypothetical protein BJX61DRAFT_533085 [Aspergillus egyptiacus]|nr:hypothetical protein BJX61DRAFT_533085 [Aspergillus egyptiacus]